MTAERSSAESRFFVSTSFRRSAHPIIGVSEAAKAKPGRESAPRERERLCCRMGDEVNASFAQVVMRGLDPRIHLLRKKLLAKADGLPGQARQ
jgi:hypothetical protein